MKKNSTLVLQHMLWRGLYFFSVLLVNIWIARFFAAEKSGQLFYIVNNLAFILLLASISLESGATYYIASGSLDAIVMARFCQVWATAASLVAFFMWWSVMYFSHSIYSKDTGFLFASFLFIAGVLYTTYFTALFYAKKEFGLPNKILFLVNTLLIALLVFGRKYTAIRAHFILIYFSSFFLQGVFLKIFFTRKNPSTEGTMLPSLSVLKPVIRYSLLALTANLIYFLVNRIDYWFVEYFCSAKDLGNYIQASKLAQMLLILPAILGATVFPIFSSQNKSGNETQLTAVIRVLFFINGGICLLILCFGWYIIPLVFGSSFNNMYLLFVLLIPGILSITMNYPMAAWFSSSRRIGINIRGAVLALIVISAGDLLMLPRYGIIVAPVMSSAGYFCYYCYTVYTYRKEYAVPWKDFLLIRKSDLNRIRLSVSNKMPETFPENPII
jgi:O-antigen/teichoic acid export membrane protein